LSVNLFLLKTHLQHIEIMKAITVRMMRMGRKKSLDRSTWKKLTVFKPYIANSGSVDVAEEELVARSLQYYAYELKGSWIMSIAHE